MARRPLSLSDSVVLVTGASSGIGEALCREAARQGAAVVLAARRGDRIDQLAESIERQRGRALAVRCDVTRDGDVERAVQAALGRFGRLDVAIANAGIGVAGAAERLPISEYQRQFETNFFGVIRTAQAALPALIRARGAFAVMGSTNGYVSLPGWSAYCASKHAVRSFATSLALELEPQGVSVTHLAPGFVESEIRLLDRRGVLRPDAVDPVPRWLVMPAERAAREMLQAIVERKTEALVTLHGGMAVFAERHAPWLVGLSLRLGRGLMARFGAQSR